MLPSGVYRHYKGPLYFVFGYGHDANITICVNDTNGDGDCAACAHNPEAQCRQPRAVVVYMALELTDAHTGPRLAVRTAEDFWAWVNTKGEICPEPDHSMGEHYCRPRFAYVGPTWEN
jgi:hypothetical protein